MFVFFFFCYFLDNYQQVVKKELGCDYLDFNVVGNGGCFLLFVWYEQNFSDVVVFEKQMWFKVYYVICFEYFWVSIVYMVCIQDDELFNMLQVGFKYIENELFQSMFFGLFLEINFGFEKFGKIYVDWNVKFCMIIIKIVEGFVEFLIDSDMLGDVYEYLIGQFVVGLGKKVGEFYMLQWILDIFFVFVIFDS